MEKKIYIFLTITILCKTQIMPTSKNNHSFNPTIDNPYELAEKQLNDAELAEKEGVEEKLNGLIKLITIYKKNYRDYIASQEPIIDIIKLISGQSNQTMEEALITLTSYCQILSKKNNTGIIKTQNIKNEVYKIKAEIKKLKIEYQKTLKYLNNEAKNTIQAALIINLCNQKIKSLMPEQIIYENPGIQNAYTTIIENKLIQDGDTNMEAALLIYFFTKEHCGELNARLEGIKK
jgi:hypothetical protein